jgi:hypothetical protein
MTARRQYSAGDPILVADKVVVVAGSTGAQTATASPSPGFWTGQTIVLRPGP